MIIGIGTDICPIKRWEHLIVKFGNKIITKIFTDDEINNLSTQLTNTLSIKSAGRWAILEAFGKAIGLGLAGWSWKQLYFNKGKIWANEDLKTTLNRMNITDIHASLSHDAGIAFAIVLLENNKINSQIQKLRSSNPQYLNKIA